MRREIKTSIVQTPDRVGESLDQTSSISRLLLVRPNSLQSFIFRPHLRNPQSSYPTQICPFPLLVISKTRDHPIPSPIAFLRHKFSVSCKRPDMSPESSPCACACEPAHSPRRRPALSTMFEEDFERCFICQQPCRG